MIDVHTHLDDAQFDADRNELIEQMKEAGLARLINSGSSHASCRRALQLAKEHDFIYCSIGIYPHDTMELEQNGTAELEQMLQAEKVVAVGEIGLDYYYDDVPREIQKKWLHRQLELAEKYRLPVVIHCRDAMRDTLEILRAHPAVHGIFHCYSGSVESLQEVLKLGYSISLGGVVTFKNARVAKEVATAVPADRLMLETDAPYLAPVPYRGKRNSSLSLPATAAEIAALRGTTPEEIERITDENATRMFFRRAK